MVFEIPLAIKWRKAAENFDFVRQAAISLLMAFVAILIAFIYWLVIFVLR